MELLPLLQLAAPVMLRATGYTLFFAVSAMVLGLALGTLVALLGIGAAFWGLVAGVLVRWFLHRPRTRPS